MFDKLKGAMNQLQLMQRLMKDEGFKALMANPKVQAVMMDPEFQRLIKTRDMAKVAAYPKFAALLRDPEVAPLLAKVNPQQLLG